MTHRLCTLIVCVLFFAATGCSTSHEVEVKPVEIKPIHITIDVNVKVDKALDDFFGDIDEAAEELAKEQTTE
ncbi:MAG TPA: hypothetical protein DHV36_23805 [Desulfobacteraceae bacterium]|nr:hypothetical protein [Desulfobacteraceae bacterium]